MMRIALVGSTGQLGRDLEAELAAEDLAPLSEDEIDITAPESVRRALESARADVVVNAAAFTDVPGCETDPARAFAVNALGPLYVARACADLGSALLHVSTDYVFDGRKGAPYTEDDPPAPLNVYGTSKLVGESFVLANCERSWVVRTSGLYGVHPCLGKKGQNFVRTMLWLAAERDEIAVVDDERLSPTWTRDLAAQIHVLVSAPALFGIVHAAAHGDCSWYEFAEEIFRLAGKKVRLRRITAAEYAAQAADYAAGAAQHAGAAAQDTSTAAEGGATDEGDRGSAAGGMRKGADHAAGAGEWRTAVRRPPYSVLDNARLRAAGLDRMRPWTEELREYLREIGALKGGSR